MAKKSVVKRNSIPDEFKRIDPSKLGDIVVYERKRPTKEKPKKNSKCAADLAKRLEQLATPKRKVGQNDTASKQSSILSTTPFSKKYKVSKRTAMLAAPRWKNAKHNGDQESYLSQTSSVAQSALSYIPTTRIKELARPKSCMTHMITKSMVLQT
ncbi:unnamed protein product [Acanthoscelides obtectus]|uniref:Uncharacterized protein n=1 Tax=Acanthoscelides obtectus TaxID=200917 RepID=A0A9P0KMU2_ACAOB|nr:unnamed protein product [Acanthoscelides obtectus]CAK1654537.1 hypothetical protein AOBTE_LOCUS18662 [Acanthoscelides obtectus]